MDADGRPVLTILDPIMRLAQLHGVERINELSGAWEQKIDDQWYLAVNGHDGDDIEITPSGGMSCKIPPYHFCVWYNGWIAALFHPYDGTFAAGDEANEDKFIAAVEKHIQNFPAMS